MTLLLLFSGGARQQASGLVCVALAGSGPGATPAGSRTLSAFSAGAPGDSLSGSTPGDSLSGSAPGSDFNTQECN